MTVSIPKGEATNFILHRGKEDLLMFQSPKGRLQTNLLPYSLNLSCFCFNPQRGGYKPRYIFLNSLSFHGFNPQRGGYKLLIVLSLLLRNLSFNPQRGGYKLLIVLSLLLRNLSFNPQRGGYKHYQILMFWKII